MFVTAHQYCIHPSDGNKNNECMSILATLIYTTYVYDSTADYIHAANSYCIHPGDGNKHGLYMSILATLIYTTYCWSHDF